MRFVFFCHAFTSCWNNGHAHFLRGVTRALAERGHQVTVCEPGDGWSRINALADGGGDALAEAEALVPRVDVCRYDADSRAWERQLDDLLDRAEVVVVQEWNEPALIAALARRRREADFLLLFHDPHHRAVTAPEQIEALDLGACDAVLAFGESLREIYSERGWGRRAFTWHEAADTALFRPLDRPKDCDLVWIGNWGDEERSRELREFLIEPVATLRLRARIHGVRYPFAARAVLREAGIAYHGWLPNHRAPEAFARARVTVHMPRRAYAGRLGGIPTIRVFEALACGIPLVCSPWLDEEGLFPPDTMLHAADAEAMARALRNVLRDPAQAADLARNGLASIRNGHTCGHRVAQLLQIVEALNPDLRASQSLSQPQAVEAAP